MITHLVKAAEGFAEGAGTACCKKNKTTGVTAYKIILSVCFQAKKVLKFKHFWPAYDIISAKESCDSAQKPCT